MGNGPGLTTGNNFVIYLNGHQVAYAPTYTYTFTHINDDFAYPLYLSDQSVPDTFVRSYWTMLRVLYKFKIGKKEEIQRIIVNTEKTAPKMWRTYTQNMLFNKKEKEHERMVVRQEKSRTYNPLDKYRSSMKGKFR